MCFLLRLLSLLSILITPLLADEVTQEELSPSVSPLGYKKIKENLEIVDENIKDLQRNILVSQQNVTTLMSEIKDLDQYSGKVAALREKYSKYLQNASVEYSKNDKAMVRLDKWEKDLTSGGLGGDISRKAEFDSLLRERSDRERWREDAKAKMNRVQELAKTLNRNEQDIRGRKKPLLDQIKEWEEKQKAYEKILSELHVQKSQFEKRSK